MRKIASFRRSKDFPEKNIIFLGDKMTIEWQTVAKLWKNRDYQLRVKVTRGRN